MRNEVSIVMTYYNRPDQLRLTLESIRYQKGQLGIDPEIIIVDDASQQSMTQTLNLFQDLNIKPVVIRPEEKTWMNPSVPYNIGFRHVTTPATIIQNPECVHIGPVIATTLVELRHHNYMTFPCYATTEPEMLGLHAAWSARANTQHYFQTIENHVDMSRPESWYNHPRANPTNLHFCSAINTAVLKELGGFDERFQNGYCFEDNEWLWRVGKILHVQCQEPVRGMVYHQWHSKPRCGCIPEWHANNELFQKIKAGELKIWHTPIA